MKSYWGTAVLREWAQLSSASNALLPGDDTPNGVLLNEWFSLIWLNEVLVHLLYGLFIYVHGSLSLSFSVYALVLSDDDDDDKWCSDQTLIAIVLSHMIRWAFHVNIIKAKVKKAKQVKRILRETERKKKNVIITATTPLNRIIVIRLTSFIIIKFNLIAKRVCV